MLHMKIIGTSREGCWVILLLSGLVSVLSVIGHLKWELNIATCIFMGLNVFAICGLLRRERRKS